MSPDPVETGADLTYTLTVHNAGPSPGAAVAVSDTLPSGLTLVSATPARAHARAPQPSLAASAAVAAGAANDVTLTIVATAGQGAVPAVTNTASVTSSTSDPSDLDNEASETTTVSPPPSADLSLTKGDAPDPVQRGNALTYTLTVHNAGPVAAASVGVSDPLPAGLTLLSAQASQGSCAGTETVTCDLATVGAGAGNDVTITIQATVDGDAAASVTNTATVSSSTSDPDPGNNQAGADTTVEDPPPPPATYVRPRGATPLRVSLVPAYERAPSPTTPTATRSPSGRAHPRSRPPAD